MIKVYHAGRSRSLRVVWMAEEMGLPYEVAAVDFRAPRPPEFLALNPANTLPVMVDGPVVLTESLAILQYLGDRHGPTELVVRPDEPGYPEYLQFLMLGEAGLAAPMNAVIGTRFFGPEDQKDNWTVGMVIEGFARRLKLVERRLEDGRRFLAADRFTAADISVGYTIGLAEALELHDKIPDAVRFYRERLVARPAFQRAAAA